MWSNSGNGVVLHLHTDRVGLGMILGPLELRFMQALWDEGPSRTAKEIRRSLSQGGTMLSLSTILTTMHRLAEKGYVQEVRQEGAYICTALVSEDDLEHFVVEHVVSRLRHEWPGHLADLGVVFDD